MRWARRSSRTSYGTRWSRTASRSDRWLEPSSRRKDVLEDECCKLSRASRLRIRVHRDRGVLERGRFGAAPGVALVAHGTVERQRGVEGKGLLRAREERKRSIDVFVGERVSARACIAVVCPILAS